MCKGGYTSVFILVHISKKNILYKFCVNYVDYCYKCTKSTVTPLVVCEVGVIKSLNLYNIRTYND